MSGIDLIGREVADKFAELMATIEQAKARVEHAADEAIQRMTTAAPPEEYDYEAAAVYLSIPRRTLERRVQLRKIRFRRDGRKVLFTKAALDEYKSVGTIEARKEKPLTL